MNASADAFIFSVVNGIQTKIVYVNDKLSNNELCAK